MKSFLITLCTSVFALVVAALAHRFFPAFGVVFKPLLWPIIPLAFAVKTRYACTAAIIVPFLSALVNGMPTYSVALELSLVGLVSVFAVRFFKRAFLLVRKAA